MKYCNDCKVYAWEGLSNCPLCGAHLDEAEASLTLYSEQNAAVTRPKVSYRSETAFMKKKSLILIMIAVAVAVVINLLTSPHSLWSGYVAAGGFFAYFGVLHSLINKKRLHSIIVSGAIALALTLLAVDLIQSLDRLGNLSGICFSLPYAVPGVFIGSVLLLDILALCVRGRTKYYFVSIYPLSAAALLPQVAVWVFSPDIKTFLTVACFVFAIANALVMTVAFYGRMKGEFKRKMHF